MYTLLKQLKDSGYEQIPTNGMRIGVYLRPDGSLIESETELLKLLFENDLVYEPTTDELIEELGNDLHCLVHTLSGGIDSDREFWCVGRTATVKDWLTGSTPREALIKLYLELHKK